MTDLYRLRLPAPQQKKIEQFIRRSPSPALARTNLIRLVDAGGPKSLRAIPQEHLLSLFRLLGGSAYLSDILVREGKGWPGFFLQQIGVAQKTSADHLRELLPVLKQARSFDHMLQALRRYKQREFVRIGARDLSPSVSVEETMRDLTALAEATLEAAYRFCRLQVEKDFGPLGLPGTRKENGFVILGMGKLGGEELNFGSDIDIIYLYEEDEGESEDEDNYDVDNDMYDVDEEDYYDYDDDIADTMDYEEDYLFTEEPRKPEITVIEIEDGEN